MGILVSWINTAWAIADAQLTDQDESDPAEHASLLQSQNHNHNHNHRPYYHEPALSNNVHVPHDAHVDDEPRTPTLTESLASRASAVPSLDTHNSAPASSSRSPASSPSAFPASVPSTPTPATTALPPTDNRHNLVPSEYNESVHPVAATMADHPLTLNLNHADRPAPTGSPPPPAHPGLRIDVSAANDPAVQEIEMSDASFMNADITPDPSGDLCFDDEGLSALEKIYLFARSTAAFHRVFISRSLLTFLPDVPPGEAVEYVIPLMNGLAMDEDEAVKEALVEDLVSSIWWFLTSCHVVDYEVPEDAEPREVPLLNVQSFTPLLGTLLLNPSANVNSHARHCVVNLLTRLRDAKSESEDLGFFGEGERRLFERELLQQVVIGMAHLDVGSSETIVDDSFGAQELSREQSSSSSSDLDILASPPPSAADDEILLSTLTTASHALATQQFLAQDEPLSPRTANDLASLIQRTPSPIPNTPTMVQVPEYEPQFAHMVSNSNQATNHAELASPMKGVFSAPMWAAEPAQALEMENSIREHAMQDMSKPEMLSPQPEHLTQTQSPDFNDENSPTEVGVDGIESGSDYNEEQAAIGKLASMSLMAAVTASGPLDQEFQFAFVKEVERAGHDPIYWVRREATFALGALAKIVPEELLYLSLMPLFEYLSEDAVWNVRQSVLFALPAILSRMPFSARAAQALKTIQRLSVDPAPQVRTGVLEVLGEVIYSFHEDDRGPPEEIIRLFIGEEGRDWHGPDSAALEMINNFQTRGPWANSVFRSPFPASQNDGLAPSSVSVSPSPSPINQTPESDPARPLICAFNLPAVVLTLGPARWPELRSLYLYLARTGSSKVKQTLAASIGEIAKIIGSENTRRDLMYRWWDFTRGRDAAVRTKALEALEVFLKELDHMDRVRIVVSLEEIWDNHLKGWREREVLAKALDRLAPLFPSNGEALRSLLRRALRDGMAAVRAAAINTYPSIYGHVSSNPKVLKMITEEVNSLAYDESSKKRLTYVECIKSLIMSSTNHDRFMDDSFWHSAVMLASDQVVDVRIGVARLLSIVCDKILSKSRTLPGGVLNIVRNLSEDPVSDVRSFVSHILPQDLRPPTELAYGHVSGSSASMATFSRPPPKREPRTLVAGISELKISNNLYSQDQHRFMNRAPG